MSTSKDLQGEINKMFNKAKLTNCWFLCLVTKRWFTPEEFKELAESELIVSSHRHDLFSNYHMVNPKEGIRSRIAYIKKASVELQEFSDRVLNYYNLTRD